MESRYTQLKKSLSQLTLLSFIFFLPSCTGKTDIQSDIDKQSYAIGYNFAKNIQTQGYEINPKAISRAIEDVLLHDEIALPEKELMEALYEGMEKHRRSRNSTE